MSCSDCTPVTFVDENAPPRNLPIKYHTCLTTDELTDAQLVAALQVRGLLVDVYAEERVSNEALDRHKATERFEEQIRRSLARIIGEELVHARLTKEARQDNRQYCPDTAFRHTVTVLNIKKDIK
jgi:hypothetical protein